MTDLTGKWALVTGSSRGIGQQIALGLARRNCNVIVHGRSAESVVGTVALLTEFGSETHAVTGDVGTEEGLASIVQGVLDGPGYVDILYNNAAVMSTWQGILDVPIQHWADVLRINLLGMVALCNAFVPGMVERNFGRIINITSGIKDQPNLAPYSVSKAAVDKYTQDLSAELSGTNVLANYVDPGWLKTDMGGENAEHSVETVLPGALVPALLDEKGSNGQLYVAQDFRSLGST